MSAMAHILGLVFLIAACHFCSAAPVHEAAPLPQQTCSFYNWCSAGSYCTQASRCSPCPLGTYQPPPLHIVYRCRQHSICAPSPLDHDFDDGRTGLVIREGNRTHDTVCECEAGKYWNVTERGCREITKCKAGEGVSNIAVPEYDTKCTPCTPGTFSDQVSATQVCTVCTDCKALQRTTLEQCTPMQDTVCGALLITQTQPVDVVSSEETSPPKDDSRSVPTADSQEPENSAVTTTQAIGGKSADVLTRPAWTAITVVAVVVSLLTAAAIAAVHISRKRRRKATNNRPEPEGGSQLEHLMAGPNSTEQEDDAGEEEEGEEEDEEEDGDLETNPKEAVSAARPPIQDTSDPKGNERDLTLKETNDGLEEIPTGPEGAEGTTFLKDARSPIQNTDDPEGNERDLHTKDATYGLEELTGDGDVTVTTSLSGEEEEEDLYKETSV